MERFLSKIQKTLKLFLALALMSAIGSSAFSAQPEWYSKLRQIKPLVTTRQEVEELFGHPKISDDYESRVGRAIEYKLKDGELSIVYSLV